MSIDAAAVGESLSILLEGGNEAEIVEKRGMEEVRESANLARDLLGEMASFFDGMGAGTIVGMDGLASLSEAEVYGEDGLRKTVVEFAAEAAALLVLEFEEMRGEAVNGALGVFHFGDVGESADDADDLAPGVELGNHVAEDPDDPVGGAGIAETENAIFDGSASAEHGGEGVIVRRDVLGVFGDRDDAVVARELTNSGAVGDAEHAVGGGVGIFDAAIRAMKNDGDMEVADESAEAFLAVAESVGSATLLGKVCERDDDAGEFAGGREFGNGVEKGPDDAFAGGHMPADETVSLRKTGSNGGGNGTEMIGDRRAIVLDSDEIELRNGFADDVIERQAKKLKDGRVGVNDAGLRVVRKNADVEIFDEGAEAFLAGTEDFFGFLAVGNIAHHDEGTGSSAVVDERGGHIAEADFAGLFAEAEFGVANEASFGELREDDGALGRIDPEVEFARALADSVFARVAGKRGEAIVDFEIRAIGKGIDAEGIRAGTERGGEGLLGAMKSLFGFEEMVGDLLLLLIGEDETNRRGKDGSSDGEPGEKEVLARDGVAHKDDEEGEGGGQELGCDGGHSRCVAGRNPGGGRLLPVDGKNNHAGVRKHPNEVSPTGTGDRVGEGEVIGDVRQCGKGKSQCQDATEGAEPGGCADASPKHKAGGEEQVANGVKDEDLAQDGVLPGPTSRREKEVKIGGDGYDNDLDEVEDARPVVAGGSLAGIGKEEQEDGSGPYEEKNVRGPRGLGSVRDEALVIGGNGLSAGLQSKGDGDEGPDLTRVGRRAKRPAKADQGGEGDHGQVEGIREEETHGRARSDKEVETEGKKDSGDEKQQKAREPARRKQGNLTRERSDGNRPRRCMVQSVQQNGKRKWEERRKDGRMLRE